MELIENVSDTAFWVAAYRAMESERPDAAFKDPLARKLAGEKGLQIVKEMPHVIIRAHVFTLRTLAIDRLVMDALAKGADMVINLAAGLDTRPYRLQLPPDLRWIEVDLPGIIEYKNEQLKDDKPVCQLERLVADLTDEEQRKALFRKLGLQCNNALVITEGLIPYLTNEQAAQLSEDLYAVPSFSYWIMDYYNSDIHTNKYRQSMAEKMKNAPFRFNEKEPLKFFGLQGWKVVEDIPLTAEAKRLKRPYPVPLFFRLLMKVLPQARRRMQAFTPGYVMFGK